MKVKIFDTDEAEKAMIDYSIDESNARKLRGLEFEPLTTTFIGTAREPASKFWIPKEAYKIIEQ